METRGTYFVQQHPNRQRNALPTSPSEFSLIYDRAAMAAIWAIGNETICKVHDHEPELLLESESIRFIHQNVPQVPLPEVIHSWVNGDRSFLIMKRVKGTTLKDAGQTMSPTQQEAILDEVVHICDLLASVTSDRRLYHPDLGPGNIMVLSNRVSAIIDWESRAFPPASGFQQSRRSLRASTSIRRFLAFENIEWRKRLRMNLEDHGYP